MHWAADLQLFDSISLAGSTAAEVAAACDLPMLSARLLLDALAGLGLLRLTADRYHLREDLRPLLIAGERSALKEVLLHRRENAVWLRASAIFRGERAPVEYCRELLDSRLSQYPWIQRMNHMLALGILDALAELVAGARTILDVGGGDGLYCGLVLARNPNATVRVLDIASGFAMCGPHRAHIDAGRLELVVGDARTFAPEPRFDLVMLHELLELFPRAEKREILRRAAASLVPGGYLVVTKFDLDATGTRPISSSLFSLRMRLKTEASYLETNEEVLTCLTDFGCVDLQIHQVQEIKAVLIGRRPGAQTTTPANDEVAPAAPVPEIEMGYGFTDQSIAQWRDVVSAATTFRSSAVLFAAAELDLFNHVASEGSTAQAITRAIGIDDVGGRLLLNALAAMGLLDYEEGVFRLRPDLRLLLTRGEHCILEEILQYRRENDIWLRLPDILRGDAEERRNAAAVLETSHLSEYLTAVELSNRLSAAKLVERLGPLLPSARRALDIGGGSGDYAEQLLAASPKLHVTLVDQLGVIDRAHVRLQSLLDGGRLKLVAGDALSLQLDPIHDIIIISDLLHYFADADKQRILANAKRALTPDGLLVVSKFTLEDGIIPPHAALFSLKVNIKKADAYLETDTRTAELMQSAGFGSVTVEALDAVKSILLARQ